MDCETARRAVRRRFDGEAAEAGAAAETHLASCPACRSAARFDKILRRWFDALPRPAAPDGLTALVLDGIRSPGGRILALRPLLQVVAAAAAVLLVTTGAAIVLGGPPAGSPAPKARVEISREAALDLLMDRTAAAYAPGPAKEEQR